MVGPSCLPSTTCDNIARTWSDRIGHRFSNAEGDDGDEYADVDAPYSERGQCKPAGGESEEHHPISFEPKAGSAGGEMPRTRLFGK